MKKRLIAGAVATVFSTLVLGTTAEAGCRDTGTCSVSQNRVMAVMAKTKVAALRKSGGRSVAGYSSSRGSAAVNRDGGRVVALIKAMAPSYGVPTWFALRIAKVESNYNPRARGRAGELGVYQLKCQTARGIGYRGGCAGLLNAHTNVQYGLKHLALAMKSSGGNLRLAASKHNGGLGRKKMVYGYVAKVF